MADKFLIIVQAGAQDMGRAVHGLTYGQELHEAGYEVKIFFDGAGTTWVKEFEKADNPFNPVFKQVMKLGIIQGACQACAGFFDVADDVENAGVALVNETASGHSSLAKYVKEGFYPIVL